MNENEYTLTPIPRISFSGFVVGDLIQICIDATVAQVVGDYCQYPKMVPRNFVVTDVEERKMEIELQPKPIKTKRQSGGYYDPVRRKWV